MKWPDVLLESVTTVITKGTTPKAFTDYGVKYIKAEALNGDSSLDTNGIYYIDNTTHELLKRSQLELNDVLLTIAGAQIGKCGIVKYDHLPANTNQAVSLIRALIDKLNPQFLYYFFKQKRTFSFIQGLNAQAAQPNINLEMIRNFRIPLPPLPIQTRIAEILSAYDDLIENNRRQIKLLEESARFVYREWFVHLRFPGHEQVKVVDGVPEGWESLPVGSCIDFNPTVRLEKDRPSKYIPMSALSTENMTINEMEIETRPSPTGVRFQNEDTLLARITPCLENGKTAYVSILPDTDGACGSTEFIVMRGKKYTPRMTYCLAREDVFREKAIQCMTGVDGRQRVKVEALSDYRVLCPSLSIQNSFDETVHPMFKKIRALSTFNTKLAAARDLLLPRLMSGELEV